MESSWSSEYTISKKSPSYSSKDEVGSISDMRHQIEGLMRALVRWAMRTQVGGLEECNSDVLMLHCCVSAATDSAALLCCGFYCCCTNHQTIWISALKRRGENWLALYRGTSLLQIISSVQRREERGERGKFRKEKPLSSNFLSSSSLQIYNTPHTSLY